MAATESMMLALGTTAPAFRLPDSAGQPVSLDDIASGKRATLVMFICNHCPFVVHVREQLAALGRDYQQRAVGIVAISANDIEGYPADRPEKMAEFSRAAGFVFPYLYDASQEVAKAYRAACTPDFYLFDAERKLVYRGQLDDSRPNNGKPVDGADLRAALDALLAGRPVSAEQKPSIGCNIKWKPGNSPDYFAD
ncbi:MAG: thioredoxin family protein [Deltaproteobacteria bacterium]|nr:thioredoxin family protein [Deltaproteobacteria bacterium]